MVGRSNILGVNNYLLSVGFRRFLYGLIFISLLFFIRPLSAQPISSIKNLKIGTAVGWDLA
ncbi:MAG: hypothetical protein RLZZ252_296, partial [Bacteroidota bacterium]